MNFFKSVFTEEPESKPESESESHESDDTKPQDDPNPITQNSTTLNAWSFGGLIKTISAKSESVIETYRRDLQEFGSGLKKEIEVAHGSMETVSHVIDEFGTSVIKGTAQIISQGKDAILAVDLESDSSDTNNDRNYQQQQQQSGLSSKRYSRFDAQVRAIQGDVNTYCEEAEDLEEYEKWRLGFVLEEEEEEIESFFEENGAMESIYKRVVPSVVDHDTFWCRYFYKVFKLKQAEEVRASLVKRAISTEEDEMLSWDVEDEEEEEKMNLKEIENVGSGDFGKIVKDEEGGGGDDLSECKDVKEIEKTEVGSSEVVDDDDDDETDVENAAGKGSVVELSGENLGEEKVELEKIVEMSKEDLVAKSDEKVGLEGKAETGESSKDKDSDFSVVSSQPSMPEEEDLGWDEIEDLSSIDEKGEKKVTHGESPNRADLRKRLSVAEEDEDLSWDIEDDDEPVKA